MGRCHENADVAATVIIMLPKKVLPQVCTHALPEISANGCAAYH